MHEDESLKCDIIGKSILKDSRKALEGEDHHTRYLD